MKLAKLRLLYMKTMWLHPWFYALIVLAVLTPLTSWPLAGKVAFGIIFGLVMPSLIVASNRYIRKGTIFTYG